MRFITTVARWLRAVFRVDPVFTDSSPPAPAAAEDLPRSSYEERRAARIARNQEARRQREQDLIRAEAFRMRNRGSTAARRKLEKSERHADAERARRVKTESARARVCSNCGLIVSDGCEHDYRAPRRCWLITNVKEK